MGVGKGDRLGIVAQNCDEFMILYGAAAKIGAILLPVNWRFQQDEMAYVLNDGAPKFVFAGPEYRKTVEEIVKGIDDTERCYTIGGGGVPDRFHPFESLYSAEGSDMEPFVPADAAAALGARLATGVECVTTSAERIVDFLDPGVGPNRSTGLDPTGHRLAVLHCCGHPCHPT